jgi:hypothetical protein
MKRAAFGGFQHFSTPAFQLFADGRLIARRAHGIDRRD